MGFLKKIFGHKNSEQKTNIKTESDSEVLTNKVFYYYLYGFVNANPNYNFKDETLGVKLFKKIIGEKGGIIISNSIHPYYTIDKDAISIWDFAYIYLLKNQQNFKDELQDKNTFVIELSTKFNEICFWEDDTRLSYEENPFFGKVVPFIIPFVVYDKERDTNFDKMILKELEEYGDAHKYLEEINIIIKQFMHESAFAIGFDEFKRDDKNRIIDNFIKAKKLFEK